ncbi:hypothetical protein GLOTRDRAFT_40495 [Gloeophyllum trabeum ATCC 11539]|uniref:C2H2-type domain-containing protein n=1 Tax=Gloeophyllum trabeum (strain ATCC 11539 / FP-39264 / Madison 617) TaxID=670483 RepID=S7Q998_GLOTA|nr:uncharacterized protein GLOTRDRAFT_40495 [Gloeophyllum trabeum ATCC 11539]EPQ56486.1 hypothetical protein GLOTRDRAFT_40495 [Gloeophyllum trabeum ATCC 11539]
MLNTAPRPAFPSRHSRLRSPDTPIVSAIPSLSPFLPPALVSTQHIFSHLRTSRDDSSSPIVETRLSSPESVEKIAPKPGVALSTVGLVATCVDCIEDCKSGSCALELSADCTDQCVVVPCDDPSHEYPLPDRIDRFFEHPCDNGADCTMYEEFCCTDYRNYLNEQNQANGGQPPPVSAVPDSFPPTNVIAPSPRLQNQPPGGSRPPHFACMWGNCHAAFNSLQELVGHVNLYHLQPETSQTQALTRQTGTPLSCHWGDCQVYPDPNSIPGPSSGNQLDAALGILANHLFQDHLGLPDRIFSPHPEADSNNEALSPFSPPTPPEPASTPAPETHDCAGSTHICKWQGCGRSFKDCDELTSHITAAHVGSGKSHYDCYWESCTRHGENGFTSKQKICRHLQSHTGHRPFQCNICKQNFSEAATLQQHMRRHTQEKPYVCDFPNCSKAFAIAGALTIHKRTHNGEKPFKCSHCGKAFAESSNLSKHLRTHTGARPYPCPEEGCNKCFARPDQLTRHMSVHKKKDVV